MSLFELFILGVCMAMDAFSVSLCKGLAMRRINIKNTLTIAAFFGSFQALMPLIGWFLGRQFEKYIAGYDHWIAFVLLVFIGVKMIRDAFKPEDDCNDEKLDFRELSLMAVATSIDALVLGVTFVFLFKESSILHAVTIMGAIAFVISVIGVIIGNFFGSRYKTESQCCGGVILVLMGIRILTDHLL